MDTYTVFILEACPTAQNNYYSRVLGSVTKLILGGGDGAIKLWSLDMKPVQTLSASDDGVLMLTRIESLLYAGCVSGTINLWDLDTSQLIRSVKAHQADVLSLSGIGGFAFSGSAKGFLKKWDLSYAPQSLQLTVVAGLSV
jgi:di- and tripeptidase